jgi:hypothetical protein
MRKSAGTTRGKKRPRTDWTVAPIVFVTLPVCPSCGSPAYRRTRTETNGDGSATRKVVCRECSEPYKISVEMPDTGNDEDAAL